MRPFYALSLVAVCAAVVSSCSDGGPTAPTITQGTNLASFLPSHSGLRSKLRQILTEPAFPQTEVARQVRTRIAEIEPMRRRLQELDFSIAAMISEEAAKRFPEAAARIDVARTREARTFREFDDAANAPLHGFAGADDYYARASSLSYLQAVGTPLVCVSARDDPFLPPETLERVAGGKLDGKRAAAPRLAGHPDRAVVRLHDALHTRQPHALAGDVLRRGALRLGMHRRDGRLQGVGPEAPRGQRPLDQPGALPHLVVCARQRQAHLTLRGKVAFIFDFIARQQDDRIAAGSISIRTSRFTVAAVLVFGVIIA